MKALPTEVQARHAKKVKTPMEIFSELQAEEVLKAQLAKASEASLARIEYKSRMEAKEALTRMEASDLVGDKEALARKEVAAIKAKATQTKRELMKTERQDNPRSFELQYADNKQTAEQVLKSMMVKLTGNKSYLNYSALLRELEGMGILKRKDSEKFSKGVSLYEIKFILNYEGFFKMPQMFRTYGRLDTFYAYVEGKRGDNLMVEEYKDLLLEALKVTNKGLHGVNHPAARPLTEEAVQATKLKLDRARELRSKAWLKDLADHHYMMAKLVWCGIPLPTVINHVNVLEQWLINIAKFPSDEQDPNYIQFENYATNARNNIKAQITLGLEMFKDYKAVNQAVEDLDDDWLS
jgi:hypothetical protein